MAQASHGKPQDVESQGKGFHAAGQRTFTQRLRSMKTLGRLNTLRVLLYDFMVPPLDANVERGGGMSTGGHYDPTADVILRIELVTSGEAKKMSALTGVMTLAAVGMTIALTYLKFKAPLGPPSARGKERYFWACVGTFAGLLLVLLWALAAFSLRLYQARRAQRHWSSRRRKISFLSLAMLLLQTAGVALSLAANALGLLGPCNERSHAGVLLGFLQWTCWNTMFFLLVVAAHMGSPWRRKADNDDGMYALVFEAPWTIHLPKLAPWAVYQGAASYFCYYIFITSSGYHCTGEPVIHDCMPSTVAQVMIYLMVGMCVVYLALYWYYIRKTFEGLASRPYAEARTANMLVRVESWQMGSVFVAVIICIAALLLLRMKACWTYEFAWLSMLPMQVMGTSLVVVLSFYFMPKTPDSARDVLAIWLQEFAWTERSLPGRLARRNAYVSQAEALQREPMFCLETAIKLCYWSHQVYFLEGEDTGWGTEGEEESGLNALQYGMSMYGLTAAEELWDTDLDTKAVLAWGQGTLLLAFKGTSSTANIKTNLKLFKAVHPPKRRVAVRGVMYKSHAVPKVHLGFLQAWTGNPDCDKAYTEGGEGYRSRLLARVAEILAEMGAAAEEEGGVPGEKPPLKIILTGHSLGGGMATLAALDLAKAHPAAQLEVYTFGQPRVGNRAFAQEYNRYVPHHFSVINDQDPVVRVPKGGYKKAGAAVIINGVGDLIVCPNFLEVQQVFRGAGVVGHHMLGSYRAALAAIAKSQFSPRRLSDGEAGAAALAEGLFLDRALLCTGMDLDSMQDPGSQPVFREGNRQWVAKDPIIKKPGLLVQLVGCGACDGSQQPEPGVEHVSRRVLKADSGDLEAACSLPDGADGGALDKK